MPDQSKIIENRLLAALMFPSCDCKARIEATPDADEEYKHTQEQNLEGLMYWLEEILKQANKHEQEIKANHISTI